MTVNELKNKEARLLERADRLRKRITVIKQNITEQEIQTKAEEIHSLEIQLQLTESALRNVQKQAQEHEKLIESKEYKEQQKQKQKLKEQAVKKTKGIFEKLAEIDTEAREVFKLCKQYDKLNKITSEHEKTIPLMLNLDSRQPFAWLRIIAKNVNIAVKRAEYIKDKLEA